MKSIAIVTDSNCGISPSQAKDLGIYMLPMPFFIDEQEYLEWKKQIFWMPEMKIESCELGEILK